MPHIERKNSESKTIRGSRTEIAVKGQKLKQRNARSISSRKQTEEERKSIEKGASERNGGV